MQPSVHPTTDGSVGLTVADGRLAAVADRRVGVVVGILALLLVGAGAALLLGVGPFGLDDGTAAPSESDGPPRATPTEGPPPFTLGIDRITECGRTCRDVTSTLRNAQPRASSDVGVTATIYAGQGTDGSVVWSGYEWVGALDAGESYTTTQRVDLSLGQALAIERADGYVTIETTVEYDDKAMTFYRQRTVA
ncbi:hypothetical protein [Haloarcula pellucida]|uniref:Uncharacterized protein n=1 Tax=Haloarcula pellucida TaxID=1427151 RepID=A0A830GK81_9EURY|nr:hypothetical protein [Halomicroarcula pellucida]GGN91357.1 hypothetical protein GCM10009030_14200 [Halomicroarcula pellucida]